MLPVIDTPLGPIETFTVFVAIAVLAMLGAVWLSLKDCCGREGEIVFIFPRIVVAGVVGFACALLYDFVFKYMKYGELRLYGMGFYGGLLGGAGAMLVILRIGRSRTGLTAAQWFRVLVPGWIVFHFFGRLGCFFGGCCYGKHTDSVWGVLFPDNPANGIFHQGLKCYPTQLYEAVALLAILAVVLKAKNRMCTYLLSYSLVRFLIEFLRGDDRGAFPLGLSPAQWISVAIWVGLGLWAVYSRKIKRK